MYRKILRDYVFSTLTYKYIYITILLFSVLKKNTMAVFSSRIGFKDWKYTFWALGLSYGLDQSRIRLLQFKAIFSNLWQFVNTKLIPSRPLYYIMFMSCKTSSFLLFLEGRLRNQLRRTDKGKIRKGSNFSQAVKKQFLYNLLFCHIPFRHRKEHGARPRTA